MVNIFTTGLQMSFGLILPEIVKHCQTSESMQTTSKINVGKWSIKYVMSSYTVVVSCVKSNIYYVLKLLNNFVSFWF